MHILAEAQVQSAQRFVQQQNLRPVYKGAGNGHALLLAAGQGVNTAVFKALERDDFQHFLNAFVYLVLRKLRDSQTEGNVVVYVQMREKGVSLKHRVDPPLVRRNIINPHTFKQHVAAGRLQEAAYYAQRGCFAAARRAQQCEELLIVDV